jgi:hypothetical protein
MDQLLKDALAVDPTAPERKSTIPGRNRAMVREFCSTH